MRADTIAPRLDRLLVWADRLDVNGTGSVDETWEIVQDLAGREPKTVAVGQRPVY